MSRSLSRRGLLRAAGVGGAGLVGLGAATSLAPAAYAAGISAIALGKKIRPHHDDWDQRCQAGQLWAEVEARGVPESAVQHYETARLARAASTIVSTDPSTAPAGSFSYWQVDPYDHVVTNIGNGYCINTSTHPADELYDLGGNLRITRIKDYQQGPYKGWSYKNGTNPQLSITPWKPGTDTDNGSGWAFNRPSAAMQKRIQVALQKRNRYGGVTDGEWGVNSIKGIQTTCQNVGYNGPVDGVPGERTCHYVQVYAAAYGDYNGPVDSVLGANSWAGFALGLERP